MYIAFIYIRIIFKECTNRPQGASDMTKQNTSGRLFNRLLKGLCIVSAICISSLSIAVDTDNDGLAQMLEEVDMLISVEMKSKIKLSSNFKKI